jgi:hypothetical protein
MGVGFEPDGAPNLRYVLSSNKGNGSWGGPRIGATSCLGSNAQEAYTFSRGNGHMDPQHLAKPTT